MPVITPGPIGAVIAILVILLGLLMALSVVPVTAPTVGGLFVAVGVARLT